MIVTYQGPDEMIVTSLEQEFEMLKEWFAKDSGRDLEEYHREVRQEAFNITAIIQG